MKYRALIATGLFVALLALLLLLLRRSPESVTAPEPAAEAALPPTTLEMSDPEDSLRAFAWTVRGKRRVSGPQRVFALKGELLTLGVSVDQDDTLDIGGRRYPLAAGVPLALELPMEQTGRVELRLEGAGFVLTVIEVLPGRRG